MLRVVCLLSVETDRATFTWSEGPASFEPYTLDGLVYKEFKEAAEAAREKLADLIKDYLHGEENVPRASFALAEAGYELYEALFDPGADQKRQAKQVRKWLEKLAKQHEVDTLEVVFESPWTLPWNVIYDQEPEEDEFLEKAASPDRWRPFWGLRYNLCSGRKVDPLRRMPILTDPKVLMVVDTEIRDGLPEPQQQRLAAFADKHGLKAVHTKKELKAATKAERPDVLYWLSHAEPDALVLSDEPVSPRDLRKLLKQDDDENVGFGGLAFLNACQTAEGSREEGSFFEAFHSVGFAGMIGTEHQTIDQFANPFGLDFLEAFLERGESVGAVLRQLRGRVPLGLLYGTYCPPDIRVDQVVGRDSVEIDQSWQVAGRTLGVDLAPDETVTRPLPPLPPEPYRSLAFYEREDRALFAGRDEDIEHFAALFDDAGTRLLVLHGESGVGKSSFLHAGVIPFLEEECVGYRFLRASDHGDGQSAGSPDSVLFVRATNDLFGQLAHALCDFCCRPYEYRTPLGESVSADMPALLREFVGCEVTQVTLRAVLRSDVTLLGRILAAISDCLPFTAILVIDQAEEIFTLAQTPEDHVRGQRALEMLRLTLPAGGDFKVILSMRTEYYGRIIDRLRRGMHDTLGVREYLLTDFDEEDLVDAILRPTAGEQIPYTPEVPFEKYGFRYADGVAEDIAHRVVRYTTQRRDSVLPLLQVICAQLYRLVRRRDDTTITTDDLEALGGIEGGMRKHVEGLLGELLVRHPRDKRPLQKLFTQLYLKQPDGTLTTALLPVNEIQRRWTGSMEFAELLRSSRLMRLLKVNTLRIGFEEERRYVSLGHDSLAKLAADWDEELSRGARMRKMATAIGIVSAVAVVMAMLAIWAVFQRSKAVTAERAARAAQELAVQRQDEAVAAQQRAEKRKQEAEENLAKAVEAVETYFTLVSEDTLLNQPGAQELRKVLLSEAGSFLADFAKKYAGDPRVEDRVAMANFNLGRISEEVYDDHKAALKYYEKALPIQEILANPGQSKLTSGRAGPELSQEEADLLAALGNTRTAMARARYKSAMAAGDIELLSAALDEGADAIQVRELLWKHARQNLPGNPEELHQLAVYQRRLADAHMNLGVFKQTVEDYKIPVPRGPETDQSALEHFEEAQRLRAELLDQLLADTPYEDLRLQVQRERARSFYNQAVMYGRRAKAIDDDPAASGALATSGMDDAELAIADYKDVLEKTPNDFGAGNDLAQTYIVYGKLVFNYKDNGRQDGLDLISEEAIARLEPLVKLNPKVVPFRATLGWAYDELGVYQEKADMKDEAQKSLQMAIRILEGCPYEGIAKSALDEARKELGLLYLDLGGDQEEDGQRGAARESLREAVKLLEKCPYEEDTESALNKGCEELNNSYEEELNSLYEP